MESIDYSLTFYLFNPIEHFYENIGLFWQYIVDPRRNMMKTHIYVKRKLIHKVCAVPVIENCIKTHFFVATAGTYIVRLTIVSSNYHYQRVKNRILIIGKKITYQLSLLINYHSFFQQVSTSWDLYNSIYIYFSSYIIIVSHILSLLQARGSTCIQRTCMIIDIHITFLH